MRSYFKYPYKCCLVILLPLLALSSCKKQEVLAPDFDVTVSKTTYAVGEAITFNVTGDADIVTFFSGAPGSEYKYLERYSVDGKPQIKFTSYRQFGPQSETMHLLVSQDFSGVYDLENLQKATWTDITTRATFSTGVDNTASGVVDLSDLQVPNTPVYIAFKYNGYQQTVSQPNWTIKNIAIDNVLSDGTMVSVANIGNLAWGIINVAGTQTWTYNTTQIQMAGGAIGTPDNEDWLITKPLQLDRVQRTFGISIKPSPTTVLTNYIFSGYTAPGTYTVTFQAINANKWDKKTTIREFNITVK